MRPAKLLTRNPMYVTRRAVFFLIVCLTHITYIDAHAQSIHTHTLSSSIVFGPVERLVPVRDWRVPLPWIPVPQATPKGGQTRPWRRAKDWWTDTKNTECRVKFTVFPPKKPPKKTKSWGWVGYYCPRLVCVWSGEWLWTQDPSHDSLLEMHRRRRERMQC